MSRISDFSAVASRYDATRHIPEAVLLRAYGLLTRLDVLPPRARVLDLGCGTGQISLPLARLGHDVLGIDVSQAMVRIAAAKAQPDWTVRHAVGDARVLPFAAQAFDVTVFSKLLMHVEDWRAVCREAVRVTARGGAVVQISDRGSFGDAVRRAFARRADERGYADRLLGPPSSSAEVPAYMSSIGCTVSKVEADELRWDRRVTPRDALEAFRQRVYAEFWSLPDPVYDAILGDVAATAAARPGGLDEPERLRPFLSIEVYRTPP